MGDFFMRARTLGVLVICFILLLMMTAFTAPANKGREYFEARNDIVWEVSTKEKVIALTFDDGPDPMDTPAILDLLRQYEAKATFFVIGKRVEQYSEIVIQEIMEGHEIANHTYSHPYFNHRDPANRIMSEMEKAEEILLKVSGQKPLLFRPPGGYYSEQLVQAAKKFNYQVVLWSWHQDTEDWNRPGVNKIVNKVLKNARNGDIILFHDYVQGDTQTVAALKVILPELKERGYRFVTVSEMLNYRQQTTTFEK